MTEIEASILDELNDLLDRERAAILLGDIEDVGRIVDSKQRLLGLLSDMLQPEESSIEVLREKLVRNQKLLDQSLNGIRAVSKRLAEVRDSKDSLETYDRSGNRQKHLLATAGKMEKRA